MSEAPQHVLTPGGTVTLPATGFGDTGVTSSPPPSGWATGSIAWCCSNWWVPLNVSAGDVLGSVAAQVQDVAPAALYVPGSQGDGGSSVILSVVAQTGSTSTTLGTASSNGSGTRQSLIVTLANPYTVPAGASIVIKAAAFALWPSSVMHNSIVGPAVAAAPVASATPCIETSTLAQIYQCETAAQTQCGSIGFGSNDFCFETLSQSCSCHDRSTAQATCAHHPEIAHSINADGSCSLVWR